MKQLIQSLKNGDTTLIEVPVPAVQPGQVLIQSVCSLVSAGTERMLVSFGKAGWIDKARQQPERVKQVWDKIRTDGLKPTVDAVWNKLGQPIPIGYSNAGRVVAVGEGVTHVRVGDRVVSNGHHAEFVSVPQNLVVRIPDQVTDDAAAFTVVGAIGLQGIRLAAPTFGETVIVIGLGLIGLLTVQLLKANGCRVIGIDIDPERIQLAQAFGIQAVMPTQAADAVMEATGNTGADAVLIATASQDNDILSLAAQLSRQKGRIVLIGMAGLHLNRSDFYHKELSFQVSCSYGPGRYDYDYEEKGLDYPAGFVRWTAQRNFEAVLQAISSGQLNTNPFITQKIPFEQFGIIYDQLHTNKALGSLILYDTNKDAAQTISYTPTSYKGQKGVAGLIGAGNFTAAILLPALKNAGFPVQAIASAQGLSAATLAQKFKIPQATSDYRNLVLDTATDTVFITTRHHLHVPIAIEALHAGKHVFVEKPLAITHETLNLLEQAALQAKGSLMTGFNRRFAPLAVKMKQLLGDTGNMNIQVTVNAGALPAQHWIHDPEVGGGRLLSELGHFIDLCVFLSGSEVKTVYATTGADTGSLRENASVMLQMQNGAHAVISYFANGSKAYDKERVEVYSHQRTLILENWRKLTGYGFSGFSSVSQRQDKGHQEQCKQYYAFVRNGGAPLISLHSLINTSRATLAVPDSISSNSSITLNG